MTLFKRHRYELIMFICIVGGESLSLVQCSSQSRVNRRHVYLIENSLQVKLT